MYFLKALFSMPPKLEFHRVELLPARSGSDFLQFLANLAYRLQYSRRLAVYKVRVYENHTAAFHCTPPNPAIRLNFPFVKFG
jgi:hypothetical protein